MPDGRRPRLPAFPRSWRRALAVLGALLALAVALATPATAQHLSFRRYASADGLTNLAASYLVRARDGDLWVGTDAGVFRFDGTAFLHPGPERGLPREPVRGLAQDATGRLWIAFDRGLYSGDAAGFEAVRTASGPVRPDSRMPLARLPDGRTLIVAGRRVLALQPDAARPGLWTAEAAFDAATLAEHPELADVNAIAVDAGGDLWLACGRQLCSRSGALWRTWGLGDGVMDAAWSTLLAEPGGRVWARSATGLVVREPGGERFIARDPPHPVLAAAGQQPLLARDARGRVFTRAAHGLARWDGAAWTEFAESNGLPGVPVTAVQVDDAGELWLSIYGQGVWRLLGYDRIESFTRAEGLANDSVWQVVRDPRGRLVFGTDQDCEWLDPATHRAQPCPFTGLPAQTTTTLGVDPAGRLWFGLQDGSVWNVPPGADAARPVGRTGPNQTVAQLRFDPDGTGWVAASANGLVRLDAARGTLAPVALPGAPARVWETTVDARGTHCVATALGLAALDEPGGARAVSVAQDGVPTGFSAVVAARDGTLWASAIGQGVAHLAGCRAEGARWEDAEAVAGAHVYFLRQDRRGWIWAGTDQGVAVQDGRGWQRIDTGDGLVWNDTNQDGFLDDDDGSVWIGTSAGLSHIVDPVGLLHRRRQPFDLRFAAASFGEHALAPGTPARLPWAANASLDWRLATHTAARSARTTFEYRLVGLSDKWIGSSQPDGHLPALEPGTYRLEARAVDPDHDWRSPVVAIDLQVLPPWWAGTPFRAGVAAAALVLLALLWRHQDARLRARRAALEAQYREREALLQKATHDGLTGLWNRSAVLEILAREIEHWRRHHRPLAVALLDVDHFKRINDGLGHLAGDAVLRELGVRVPAALRAGDWVGRYGGEELLAILPDLAAADASVVERLRESVADTPFPAGGRTITVTLSVGIAWCEPGTDTAEALLARADAALYAAKAGGRNQVVHGTPALAARGLPEPAPGPEAVRTTH